MTLTDRPHTVYVLRDPRDKQVRYVGITSRTLTRRLQSHISDTANQFRWTKEHGVGYKISGCCRVRWLTELRLLGLNPLIEPLDTVDQSKAIQREEAWISLYLELGCNLTNEKRQHIGNPQAWVNPYIEINALAS